jgi:hypothetical protein
MSLVKFVESSRTAVQFVQNVQFHYLLVSFDQVGFQVLPDDLSQLSQFLVDTLLVEFSVCCLQLMSDVSIIPAISFMGASLRVWSNVSTV